MGRLYTLCLSILLPETCEGNKLSSFTLLIITDHRALKRDLGFRCLGKSRDFLWSSALVGFVIASVSYSHPRVETFWNKELHQHRLQLHHVCSPTAYTKHHSHMRYIHHLIIIYISISITSESMLLILDQKCSRLHNPLAGVPYPILKGLSPQSALFCCFYIVSIVIYVYIEGKH